MLASLQRRSIGQASATSWYPIRPTSKGPSMPN